MENERYDEANSTFSPEGRLFQVEYAKEAVKKASCAVGVKGSDVVVLAAENKLVDNLQVEKAKICSLDQHIAMTFSGFVGDARIIIDRARVECQTYESASGIPIATEQITRFVAELKQQYTQCGRRRPFGVSTLIAGFDMNGKARLFRTDPAGVYCEWKATAIGKNEDAVNRYLERIYLDEVELTVETTIKLAVKALLGVVRGNNLEIGIIQRGQHLKVLDEQEVEKVCAEIETEEESKHEENNNTYI